MVSNFRQEPVTTCLNTAQLLINIYEMSANANIEAIL